MGMMRAGRLLAAAAIAAAAWLAASGARLIGRGDVFYPAQLAAIPGAPPQLFVLGDASLTTTNGSPA